jgi:DnaK suppressor protein
MEKDFIGKNKALLEKEKKSVQEMLQGFAEKKENSSEWDTKFPDFRAQGVLDEEADEVEEYSSLLPIEKTLEKKLEKIEKALEKIEKKNYGLCEKCGQEIEEDRLKLVPETDLCSNCI